MRACRPGHRRVAAWAATGVTGVALALAAAAPAGAAQICLPGVICTPDLSPTPPPAADPAPAPAPPRPAPLPGDATPGVVPAGSPSQVTSFVDPQHTSYATDGELSAPIEGAWTRRLDGAITDVVAGDGRVFVVVGEGIQALDVTTGKPLWTIAGRSGPLAYDAGRVFGSASGAGGGEVVALSAADGHELWRGDDRSGYSRSTAPVAVAGRVYYGTESGSSSMIARDAATGRRLWQSSGSGTGNTPTVDGSTVFGSYACGLTDAWNRGSGAVAWATTSNCSGGGGSTATAYGGRLYVPEDGAVLDANNGGRAGTTPRANGVFAHGLAIHTSQSGNDRRRLRAVRLAGGRTAWRFTFPQSRTLSGGPGSLVSAPPVGIGDTLWAVEKGEVVGFDLRTGRIVAAATTTLTSSDSARLVPLGSGHMALVNDRTIVGIRSAVRPAPDSIAALPTTYDLLFGRSVGVRGRVGSALQGGRPRVTVEADPAGRGGYRRVATVRPGADGRFEVTAKLDRNSRVRVRVGRRTAAIGTVYVEPRYRVGVAAVSRTRFRARVRVRGSRSVGLRGRRTVVYVARPGAKVYLRLGSGRLRRTAAGVHASTFLGRRRAYAGTDQDYLVMCIPGAPRLGLGRTYLLDRRCGRDRVPLR